MIKETMPKTQRTQTLCLFDNLFININAKIYINIIRTEEIEMIQILVQIASLFISAGCHRGRLMNPNPTSSGKKEKSFHKMKKCQGHDF